MRWLFVLMLFPLFGFTSCSKKEYVEVPGPVRYRDKIVVQKIPESLLIQHPVATGPLSQCPDVAAQRRAALEACNGALQKIKEGQE